MKKEQITLNDFPEFIKLLKTLINKKQFVLFNEFVELNRKQAKKEVFDDLDMFALSGMWYDDLKKKHLGESERN